jgi:CPA1 family monovalent cation:H+ antiporter
MALFEWTLLVLAGAVVLATFARRIGVPYPSLLAIGGTALALLTLSSGPRLDPALALALFVAPVLVDASFDASLRDLRANWIPLLSLVVVAVVLTAGAVAAFVHAMVPGLPWAAAITLGAIVAPPDAGAATAVLRPLRLPQRLLVLVEGESLLNDASALLIYRVAVAASVPRGAISALGLVPTFVFAIGGAVLFGYALAFLARHTISRISDAPSQILMQFVATFSIWILADRLGLSPIVTLAVFGLTAARSSGLTPARLRVPSFAVWETVVFLLNVLAFVLIGLQLRPILGALAPAARLTYLGVALSVLAMVIIVRGGWVLAYVRFALWKARRFGPGRWPGPALPTLKGAIIISWSGMRGIVTLAAAYALPTAMPFRDLIVFCAFGVVVGTLVVQGLTLKPLIEWLNVGQDTSVDREVHIATERLARVAIAVLEADGSLEARIMRQEFTAEIRRAGDEAQAHQPSAREHLRARIVAAQRQALVQLRDSDEIGDDAFHVAEERLDWVELDVQVQK